MSPKVTSKRDRTRQRLIDAAVPLFAAKGVEATSILDITKEAGAANGTFYNYFADKAELVASIYQHLTDDLARDIIVALDQIDDPRDQVALGTIWFLDAVGRDLDWGAMAMDMLEQDTPFRKLCRKTIKKYVDRGIERGDFAADAVVGLIDFNVALLIGAIRLRLETTTTKRDIAAEAAELQLRMLGLSASAARKIPALARARHGARPAHAD